jgi:hypothetical protein
MATMVTERPTDHEQIVKWQSFFDEQLREVGVRAPPSVAGQSPEDYVRETCRTLKRQHLPQNDEYYQVNYRGLVDSFSRAHLSVGLSCVDPTLNDPLPGPSRPLPGVRASVL